jgi:hypothetical protein
MRKGASGGIATTPCSSLARTSGQPLVSAPKSTGAPGALRRSEERTLVPASTTARSGAGRDTTVASTNAARSFGVAAP